MAILDVHRSWLKSGAYYRSRAGTLPQNDPAGERRAKALARTRKRYAYNHDYLPPIPLLDDVPDNEQFSKTYILGRTRRTAVLLPDVAKWKFRLVFDRFDALDDFAKLYTDVPVPASVEPWRDDAYFAEQRLSGPNPLKIERVRSADQVPFALDFLDDAEARIAAGALYVADYRDLDFVQGGDYESGRKHLPTPVALFGRSDGGDSALAPLAIRVAADAPVLTPDAADHFAWMVARTCVQIADANHHEMSTHLSRCHFAMSPFGIATARQLAANHPVGLLLRPHLRFLMINNELGRRHLVNPGGIVDHLLAGTLAESLEIVARAWKSWSLADHAFPRELESRGVDDAKALPDYAYRDDGRLLWDAIDAYVGQYLDGYYASDADVRDDPELQAWAAELAAEDAGRVRDMPGALDSRAALHGVLRTVIFTSAPQHSAVNYAQYDFMAYVPNMPLAAYLPADVERPDASNVMQFLPSRRRTEQQLEIMDQLTCYRHDRLGHYHPKAFADDHALEAIARFQARLAVIEAAIDDRNAKRRFPYPFLKPSLVLNSTSI